jgi:xanthine dehydrogenase YagR molybdenum-binding subunit
MAQESNAIRSLLGQPLDRVDGKVKVTGRAPYAYEHNIPNVATGVLVTSTIARGRIRSIDSNLAEKAPGVLLVMTHRNAPKMSSLSRQPTAPATRVVQAFQDDVVWYGNQPIALVVAESLEQAEEAAFLLTVQYEEQAHAVAMDDRLVEAYAPPKAGGGGDASSSSRGDMAAGLQASGTHFERVYRTPDEVHNPMEPHATIAIGTSQRA